MYYGGLFVAVSTWAAYFAAPMYCYVQQFSESVSSIIYPSLLPRGVLLRGEKTIFGFVHIFIDNSIIR